MMEKSTTGKTGLNETLLKDFREGYPIALFLRIAVLTVSILICVKTQLYIWEFFSPVGYYAYYFGAPFLLVLSSFGTYVAMKRSRSLYWVLASIWGGKRHALILSTGMIVFLVVSFVAPAMFAPAIATINVGYTAGTTIGEVFYLFTGDQY